MPLDNSPAAQSIYHCNDRFNDLELFVDKGDHGLLVLIRADGDKFRIEGFVAPDRAHRWDEALRQLSAWMREGRLTHREEILDGIDVAPGSIAGLYRGENLGKRVIRFFSEH